MQEKRIEYKNGIIANVLSGFYEQVAEDKKDESLRPIFEAIRKEIAKLREENDKLKGELLVKCGEIGDIKQQLQSAEDKLKESIPKEKIMSMLENWNVHHPITRATINTLTLRIKELGLKPEGER